MLLKSLLFRRVMVLIKQSASLTQAFLMGAIFKDLVIPEFYMQPESCASEYSGQDYFTESNIQCISTLTMKLIILQIKNIMDQKVRTL